MQFGVEVSQVVNLVLKTFACIGLGIIASGIGEIVLRLGHAISRNPRDGTLDPTLHFRAWRDFYQWLFEPFGRTVASQGRQHPLGRAMYIWGVGVSTILVMLVLYFALSGATISAMLGSYYMTGTAPNLSPLIELSAGFCLLFAMSVILHAVSLEVHGEVHNA